MSDCTVNQLSINAQVNFPGFSLNVVHDLELDGVTGLFGPSGSGKSTLLRVIAGLEQDVTGKVSFSGESWLDSENEISIPAHQRPVGYVFQDARLFPHLSVQGNLQFAEHRNSSPGGEISRAEVVSVMNLGDFLDRDVDTLSGGERQRVAIARTLLTQPRLLLLDEPLAALDVGHKQEILPYLEALPNRFGLPAIFVSHAVNEMARLADNVIVLENGSVTASGSAAGILSREELQMSAMPFEAVSIFDVRVVENLPGEQLTRVTYDDQRITIPGIIDAGEGDSIRLVVRAGDVVLATAEPKHLSVRNVLHGKIEAVDAIPDSPFSIVSVDIGGAGLKAQLTQHAIGELGLTPGMMVYALIKTATFDRAI
jgi:molybdate transport system ATP-binding protein